MKPIYLLALFIFFYLTTNAQNLNALRFDGVNDYVSIPDHNSLDLLARDSMTIEFWFKTSSTASFLPIIAKSETDQATYEIGYAVSMYSGILGVAKMGNGVGLTYAQINTTLAFNDNSWHHFAAVLPGVNANNYQIYIDNILQNTYVQSNNFDGEMVTSVPLQIGKAFTEFGSLAIDEFRIWDNSKTQTEIKTNMHNELLGNEKGLVVCYHFNQGLANENNDTITTLTDSGPNNHQGTLHEFELKGTASNWVGGAPIGAAGIKVNTFAGEFKLYPNPTDGNISVNLGKTYHSVSATISDLNGKLILSKNYNDTDFLDFQINEPAGVYLLTIESEKSKAIIRLIKK